MKFIVLRIITRFMLASLYKYLSKVFLIVDYLIINLCFVLGDFYFFEYNDASYTQNYKVQLLLLNMSWLSIILITRPYSTQKITDSSLHFNAITKSYILLLLVTIVYLALVFSIGVNLRNVIIYFILIGISLIISKFLLFLARKKHRLNLEDNKCTYESVVVGENELSKYYLATNSIKKSLGIKGFYSIDEGSESNEALGNLDQLFNDLEAKKFSNIIFCDNSISSDIYEKLVDIAELKMLRIYMSADFKFASLGTNYLDNVHGIPLLKVLKEPLSNPNKQILKRTFDILFSTLVILFILSWLIPIIALIIKIESGESLFFSQKRSGLKNKSFNCLKFRSMTSNKNADIQTVSKNDKRITKFGAFIRKTSIDELPQFINVFMGDMSVVGPRPHMLSQTEIYSKITKKYMTRHMVKPGITGWAQVMGARGEIFSEKDMENRIEKDIWYIQNWSFFLDIKIIFLTLYNIIKGDEQAY